MCRQTIHQTPPNDQPDFGVAGHFPCWFAGWLVPPPCVGFTDTGRLARCTYSKDVVRKDVDVWSNFEYLHNRLLAIQRKTANRSEPEIMSEVEKNIFLNEERELS